jgi:HAD superfamily hydrolase (TIGR01509 family)
MDFLVDIGRVLLDFDFESSLSRLIPQDTPDTAARLRLLQDRKDEFESGAISADDYTAWAIGTLGSSATAEEFHDAWRHIFTPVLPMWDCIRRLKSNGHRLILFSNTNAIHVPWAYEEFDIFSQFDGAVISYEVGAIKPHPEIYRHAIDNWHLDPARTIYIDDLPANIDTGRKFGFLTWQYDLHDHDAFESWLAGHIGRP